MLDAREIDCLLRVALLCFTLRFSCSGAVVLFLRYTRLSADQPLDGSREAVNAGLCAISSDVIAVTGK